MSLNMLPYAMHCSCNTMLSVSEPPNLGISALINVKARSVVATRNTPEWLIGFSTCDSHQQHHRQTPAGLSRPHTHLTATPFNSIDNIFRPPETTVPDGIMFYP